MSELSYSDTTFNSESYSDFSIDVQPIHKHGPQEACFICMDTFQNDIPTSSLQNCFRCYCYIRVHTDCINQWINTKAECPICHKIIHNNNHQRREQYIRRRRRYNRIIIASVVDIIINILAITTFVTCMIVFQPDTISQDVVSFGVFLLVFNFAYYCTIVIIHYQ